ncbi:MAG: hypothetical protein WB770_10835 [Acidimicrobiales bacterium]
MPARSGADVTSPVDASVGYELRAGQVAGFFGCQDHDHIGQILRLSKPTEDQKVVKYWS